jgi:hypothetical protein
VANLKGPGSMKAVNLVAVTFPNSVTKDGKSRYLDVQINAQDQRGPGQTNLHLVTERVKDKEGKDRINNGAPYSTAQFDAIKEAAGDNVVTLPNGAEVYSVKADLMPSSRKSGLVLNTKTVEPSEFPIDASVLDAQFASVKSAKEAAKEAKATDAPQADAAEAQAEAPQADAAEVKADEPALA